MLKEGYEGKISEDELLEFGKEKLAKYKYPRKIEFIKEIPKGPAKYLKRKLKNREVFGEDLGVTAY